MQEPTSDSSPRTLHGETFKISEPLEALLDRWETLKRAGTDVTAEQLCEENPDLQLELENYLACLQDFSRFEDDDHGPMPERIGPYDILSELGRGGHAVVYLAHQDLPMRKVALKLLQNVVARPRLESRFRLEIQLLGTLRHPNTARIFEAGTAEVFGSSHLYYTMEWIDGQDVLSYVRTQVRGGDWDHRDTLQLCLHFCDALSEAHAEGVVHRDLKPGNMLVDSDGNPKLIDFGLARTGVLGAEGRSGESTADGWVGTRVYMSPEQFGGDPALVDARTDVYGFAVVLYQLLVDELPYPIERTSMWETARVVKETAPLAPSRLAPGLRGDVDVILGKALSKDQADRYPTIDAFADDLRATLEGRPISARRPNAAVSLLKWCRRHRRAAVASGTSVAMILFLAVAALIAAKRASEHAGELDVANHSLREQKRELLDSNRRYDESVQRLERTAFNRALLRLGTLVEREPGYVLSQLEDASVFPHHLRGYAWKFLRDTVEHPAKRWFAGTPGVTDVAISDDGGRVACCGPMGVKVWDVASQATIAGFPERLDSPKVSIAFDRTGDSLLFCRQDGKVGWLDVRANRTRGIPRPSGDRTTALAHAPGEERFFIADESGTVELWSGDGPRLLWEEKLADEPIIGIGLGSDQDRFATVTRSGVVILARADSGESIESQQIVPRKGPKSGWLRARFSSDLSRVFVAQKFDVALVWDLDQQRLHQAWSDCGLLPDGDFRTVKPGEKADRFAVSGRGKIDVWSGDGPATTLYRRIDEQERRRKSDMQSGMQSDAETGQDESRLNPVALDVSGRSGQVAILLRDGGIVVRSCTSGAGYESLQPARATVAQIAWSPKGTLLVTGSGAGYMGVHSSAKGNLIRDWQVGRQRIFEIAYGNQERYFLTRATGLGLVLWDAIDGVALDTLPMPKAMVRMAWIEDRVLVGMSAGEPVWVPIIGTGKQQRFGDLEASIDDGILASEYDPVSGRLATALESGQLVVWRLSPRGGCQKLNSSEQGELRYMAMHPGGETLLTGNRSGLIQVFSLPDLRSVKRLEPNANHLGGIAISPDGSVMASGHFDGEILFWDVVNWEPQLSVQTNLSPIRELGFSADGHLAVGGKGPELAIFRANPNDESETPTP